MPQNLRYFYFLKYSICAAMTLTHLLTLIGRLSPPSFGLILMSYRARSVFWGYAHATDSDVSVLDSISMEATPVGTETHRSLLKVQKLRDQSALSRK